MTDHRRSLLAMSGLLLRQMEELTDELVQHTRPLDEIRADASQIQLKWNQIMQDLSACQARSWSESSIN